MHKNAMAVAWSFGLDPTGKLIVLTPARLSEGCKVAQEHRVKLPHPF